MNTKRIIKIFMASSDELESDRAIFGNLIRRLNDLYRNRGIYIELFQWEDFDAAYNGRRKQDEYNDKVRESDAFFAFFHRKAGEFTVEEFNVALDQFDKNAQPKVYAYIRDLMPDEREDDSLKAFKERLYRDLGHYWCRYGNTDTMQLHFVMQFQLMEENRHTVQLDVKDSVVKLEGEPVANLKNVPFVANNDAYRKMTDKIVQLNERVTRYRERVQKDPDNPDYRHDLSDALQELDGVSKELEQHETFLFDLAKTFAQMAGRACSERMRMAKELFEQGKAAEANGILATEDLDRDASANLRRWEQDKARVEEDRKTLLLNIAEYLLKTRTAMADDTLPIPERFRQTCDAYDKAIDLQKKLEVSPEDAARVLFDYAYLLNEFKHYNEAIPSYSEALKMCRDLALRNPDAYLSKVAGTLNNLAVLHVAAHNYETAEREYSEALEIYRDIVSRSSEAYLPDVATTLCNLAILHVETHNYEAAEREYSEALKIRSDLASCNPEAFLPNVATMLNNLANLHVHIQNYEKPEREKREYFKAQETYRDIASRNPEAFLPDVAMTLHYNLAKLINNTHNYEMAEREYSEALEIYRDLVSRSPEAYLPDVATTLCNLAALHADTQNYEMAEREYSEALEIRRTLVSRNPEVYGIEICRTAYGYGKMLLESDINSQKGLQLLEEALRLAENSRHAQAQDFVEAIKKIINEYNVRCEWDSFMRRVMGSQS